MNKLKLMADLERDEDNKLHVYVDSRSDSPLAWTDSNGKRGIPTIGVGRNLLKGIALDESHMLLLNDVESAEVDLLNRFPPFVGLSDTRQRVLANMCFNLGIERFLGFKKFLAAVQRGDWREAAIEMLASAWAEQVKSRATRLRDEMLGG